MASKGKATGKTPSEPQGIPDDGIEVTSAETHDIAGPVTENDGNVPSHAEKVCRLHIMVVRQGVS